MVWLPRLVISLCAAGIAAVLAVGSSNRLPFDLEIVLASTAEGTLQVFYDRGAGISEAESVTTRIRAATAPVTYRIPIPAGTYRLFRIDPNDRGGQYAFSSIRILTASGTAMFSVPLNELSAVAQASLTTSANAATAIVPDGANDPQLLYAPASPLALAPADVRSLTVVVVLAAAAVAFLIALGLERAPAPWRAGERSLGSVAPVRLVALTGLLAAIVATYPLFVGRSLVSPNNGGAALLYDEPPYTYASNDFTVEDARGTDIGSMMWAILPYWVSEREAVASGELPLWNRYNAIGRPLWGQAQHFFFDPLHLVALPISEPSYYADVAFIGARIVFAIGAGLATLMATGSPQAAALVATAAPFIGHFAFRFNHPAYFSIVYAPWILWAYFRLASRQSTSQLAKASSFLVLTSVLQLIGSTPKEGVIAFAVAQMTGFIALLLSQGTASERIRRLLTAGAAVALALMIAAPHWLIFLDTLSRAYTAYDAPSVIYGGWHEVAALALGTFLPGMPYPSLNGVVAVMVITAAFVPTTLWRHRSAFASFIGGIAAVSIACGAIPAGVMLKLPLLANLHHVWNVFLTAALAPLLIVAGAGLVALRQAPLTGAVGSVLAAVLLAIAIDLGLPDPPMLVASLTLASLVPGLMLALLVAAATSHRALVIAPAVAVVLAVGLLPGGLQLETGIRLLDQVLLQPRPRVDLDETPPSVAAVRERAKGDPFRVASIENILFPGVQAYYRLEGITGPDALELRELRELSDAAGIYRTEWGWRTVLRTQDLPRVSGFLDMMGVRFVFGRSNDFPSALPLAKPDTVHVIERQTSWPRAFFVEGVQQHANVNALIAALQIAHEPFASVDVRDSGSNTIATRSTAQRGTLVVARDYQLSPNHTSFVIDAPGPGVAVLGEAYVPRDFVATLNGERVDYFRVNHAFKAVSVPAAGSWTVSFEYRPERWRLSWIVSVGGLITVAALLLFFFNAPPPQADSASARSRSV